MDTPRDTPTDEDDTLRELLLTDADQALTRLFELHYSYLCRVAVRILKEEATAEDLVQDVFYELWRKRDQLRIIGKLRSYLHRAVRNRSLNYLRDQRLPTLGEEALLTLGTTAEIHEDMAAADLQDRIDEVIDSLPERCRLVFVLSRFEDMSQREIARQLNISTKTVENQMTKALKVLKEKIYPYLSVGMLFVSYLTWTA